MTITLNVLGALLLASPAEPPPVVELMVRAIIRPVEMESRTVQSDREVHLATIEEAEVPDGLIGLRMKVSRPIRPDSASSWAGHSSGTVPVIEDSPRGASRVWKAENKAADLSLVVTRAKPIRLNELAVPPSGTAGEGSAFASRRRSNSSDSVVMLGATETPGTPPAHRSEMLSGDEEVVEVGIIQITDVTGQTIKAKIIKDGLMNSEKGAAFSARTIQAGDRASGRLGPLEPDVMTAPIDAAELKRLKAERRRLRRALNRRNRKPKPYRRKVMKWDL